MSSILHLVDQLLSSGSPWVYAAIFAVALPEGFVLTTFLVSGTIAIAAIGALVARGYFNPVFAFGCIYLGTLLGDSLSYLLSTRLQYLPAVAARLRAYDAYRAPLARRPFIFTVLGHLTPYLKGVNAFLAGGVLSWRSWFLADAVGALCGTLFFGGLGAMSSFLLTSGALSAIQVYGGIALLCLFILLWIRSTTNCRLRSATASPSLFCPRHRNWKRLFFIVYYIPWHIVRWVEALLRKLPSRSLRKNLSAAFPDVRAGDIFLVRLHSPAPWGKWAHTAIALGDNRFCHGFGKTITAHRLEALPIRYAIAHLRVRCDDDTALRAAAAASEMIRKPVSIFARRGDISKFSCASLAYYAYATVGIMLHEHEIPRVIPDDLISSPLLDVLRVVFTEHTRAQTARQGAPDADHQRA